jgi:hypothetical protein
MAQRELLGDHPAHRDAQHVSALELQRVEQPGGVVGELDDAEALVDTRRVPHAAMVVGDQCEPRIRERGLEGLAPGEVRPAHPLDEQQRLALAAAEVVQALSGDVGVRHGGNPRQL